MPRSPRELLGRGDREAGWLLASSDRGLVDAGQLSAAVEERGLGEAERLGGRIRSHGIDSS